MQIKQYRIIQVILLVGMLSLLAAALLANNGFIALLGVGQYLFLTSLFRLKVSAILTDERQHLVQAQAVQASFQILMPILLFSSLTLLIGFNQKWAYLQALGVILSYIFVLGTIIYALSYWYFDRQSGGR